MDKPILINSPTEDASDHALTIDKYIEAMNHLQVQMSEDRREILMLQAETRAILDDVMTTLKAN